MERLKKVIRKANLFLNKMSQSLFFFLSFAEKGGNLSCTSNENSILVRPKRDARAWFIVQAIGKARQAGTSGLC